MADTPSKQDQNIQFLYSVLTVNGNPTVDWNPICVALNLDKGAVAKRWSRLKQAMDKQEKPAASNEELLWLMLEHSERRKGFDWQAIAEKCGSTKGAVSKRYSRMKLAFERGDAPPPSTPSKGKNAAASTPKKTPAKGKVKSDDDDDEATPTTTPKRKRTPAKKKLDYAEIDDEDEQDEKPKRAKSTPKAKRRPTNAFRASDEKPQTVVKGEPVDSDGDVFTDAPEQALADVDAEDEIDEVLLTSLFSDKFTHAREMADVLINRKIRLTSEQRNEVDGMLDVLDGLDGAV
ncbi:hypothetical protein E8E12_006916 [Didymella heteroderae]|uniref:Myb-like DNA-binding domain-containing protein n=1 Tax=Didymella heteroderae TaxID=1769908 RepID=A0A9P4WX00_9PLEO|nr:hypothetical protein E8E12_006916 [Didymella heteroderae]